EGLLAAFDNVQLRITPVVGDLYFRNTFTLGSPSDYHNYRLAVSSDDSAEVYVNGQLVHNDTTGPHAARYWNVLNATVNSSALQSGQNVIAVRLRNNDRNEAKLDLRLLGDSYNAIKAMLIMSDGAANICNGPDDGEMDTNGWWSSCTNAQAVNETVEFACWAHQAYGIKIYSVAFGPEADPESLNRSACCDNCSNFYSGSNVSDLYAIYEQIASQILTGVVVQESQTLTPTGNVSTSALFSDSYLDVSYTYTPPSVFGTISLSVETDKFTSCSPTVSIDPNFDVVSARVTSYSGVHWTSRVDVNGINVYNLSEYSTNYTLMGDPFQLFVPPDLLVGGINDLFLDTADDPLNSTGCSLNNTLIYTALVNLSVPYGGIYSTAAGCNWTVEFEDNTTDVLAIPASASPVVTCNYTNANITYNGDDAYDAAAFALFSQLDFDDDGRLDVQFDQADLSVDSIQIDEVPSLWGPTTAEVRTWR
ncbi:hypothetical protein J4439_04065, partial [Candidatus Woesearchaeota archaeon]|nr:hypothetical protein [Candidatus Woesearchaeota archaeon]